MWGTALMVLAAFHLQRGKCQLGVPDEPNVLTPPYFNIATGKKMDATATCGEGNSQVFCKLTGGPNEYGYGENLYQGQYCDVCDANDLAKSHPIKYAIDGTEKWWQSPPLSQGTEYNRINITLHLGQVFHVAYVIIKFANSPRAGTWVLERSSDHGKTYQPWQYFANSNSDCYNLFGIDAFEDITRDDSVICTSEYSDAVPLERGEVIVSMINGRPGAKNFSHSPVLQEWTLATDVRLRLLRTKTLLGHLMAVQRQDPTVTRRYYYSIKDVSIGGRCVCNGHADTCAPDSVNRYKLKCDCRHNTCGDSCEYCCPGFVQKAWQAAVPESSNECEQCNCHGHTTDCIYDENVAVRRLSIDLSGSYEGGGVCQNCSHNTAGINCEKCVDGYYRPAEVNLWDPNGCRPCECDSAFTVGTCEPVTGRCYCKPQYEGDRCDRCAPGHQNYPECEPCPCYYNATRNGVCLPVDGECPCKYNFAGMYCDECEIGFYNFPTCIPCACHGQGAINENCDQYTGQCICSEGYGGLDCDQCSHGYFKYPVCQSCSCIEAFTTSQVCDPISGACLCTDLVTGDSCSQCISGYFDFPNCRECECSSHGSLDNLCDRSTGGCRCLPNYQGTNCDECAPEFYDYPNCLPCDCSRDGSVRTTCDSVTGQCSCYGYISGRQCDVCTPNYFNFPRCEDCKCDPRGIKEVTPGVCRLFSEGRCDCKKNVIGKYCDKCDSLHYDLSYGCVDCTCFLQGTLDGVASCDSESGNCWCKTYANSQRCSHCDSGFYGLEESSYFGCSGCQCDAGGAISTDCDPVNGQCRCKRGVTGRRCDSVEPGHYFPTLLQHQFEIEEGSAANGEILRYGYDPAAFPGFSEKGYGEFSIAQREIIVPVDIENHGIYGIYFHYMQPYEGSIGEVTFTPVTAEGTEQTSEVDFDVTLLPKLKIASSVAVLNRGRWNVMIRGSPGLLVDYFILLPNQYYEPTILQAKLVAPCQPAAKETGKECIMYTHPSLEHSQSVELADGVVEERRVALSDVHPEMVLLYGGSIEGYDELEVTLMPEPMEKYVLILEYSSTVDRMQTVEAVVSAGRESSNAKFNIYSCEYAFTCRQVALSSTDEVMIFDVTSSTVRVEMSVDRNEVVHVARIHAIPYREWSMEYVEPKRRCITKEGGAFDGCIAWQYPIIETGRKFEAGGGNPTLIPVPTATDGDVKAFFVNQTSAIQIDMDLVPGRYVFLLHYYNPYHLSFSPSIVISGGVTHTAGANVAHCPDGDGCRAVVVSTDRGDNVFDITNPTQLMTITVPEGKSFWLQYVLAVPEDSYKSSFLDVMLYDHSRKFLEECFGVGGEGLIDLAKEPSEFCRDAVFTLTMDYNDGALTCDCLENGTSDGTKVACEAYGGKCLCKRGVVGRKCEQCATGYHGFPDCKPCDCNGTLCDELNGNCICAPNTAEPDCKHCAPFTHSYHPLAGCIECDCNREGVEDAADLGCSEDTGQCRCKENVEGQRCDRCMPGFFSFPDCRPCVCDERGRVTDGCDHRSGQCICKENVEGQQCDRCKSGTFYLDANNPNGCTKCFCFDISGDCTSTLFPLTEVVTMEGWRLLNMKTSNPEVLQDGQSVSVDIIANGGMADQARANLYWAAPAAYLRDKLGSYGGILQYVAQSRREDEGGRGDSASSFLPLASLTSSAPNVILEGNGMVVGWINRASRYANPKVLTLTESNFVYQGTGNPVKREDFMTILSYLSLIRIRASDDPYAAYVSLSDVSLTTTDYTAPIASGPAIPTVEECICPQGYMGESCQLCASGHYRDEVGPYLGYCVECDCYGHCDRCDVSGLLDKEDCLHNTAGDRCEICQDGYIGDAKSRNPDACQPCPCPYQTVDGNFAKTCHYDDYDEVVCICEPGYSGSRCEQCDFGYFGNPRVIGGKCQQCNCNDNLDQASEVEPCDSLTGECSDCKYNTGGRHCERCTDSYYGDAVGARNCTECPCLECGTLRCDHVTGFCACQAHVVGPHCDLCEPGFFDLESCGGCKACNCDLGATGRECDEFSGQCDCAPNVVGQKCDRCERGHWDFLPTGCKPCNCYNDGDCNPATGECQCPPGIVGPQCDRCEIPRHVIPPLGKACEPCDVCTHELLDNIEDLTKQARDASRDIASVSAGATARRKLEKLGQDSRRFQLRIAKMDEDMDDVDQDGEKLLRPRKVDFNDLGSGSGMEESSGAPAELAVFEEVETDSYDDVLSNLAKVENKVGDMCNHTEALLERAEKTGSRAIIRDAETIPEEAAAVLLNREALELLEELNVESSGDDQQYFQRLFDGKMMVERMKMRDFGSMKTMANEEFVAAEESFKRVNSVFLVVLNSLDTGVNELHGDLSNKLEKLNGLRTTLNDLQGRYTDVVTLNAANRKALETSRITVTSITTIWDEINAISEDSDILLGRGSNYTLPEVLTGDALMEAMIELAPGYQSRMVELQRMAGLVNTSTEHANMLMKDVVVLAGAFSKIKIDPQNAKAIDGANRYVTIFNVIDEAQKTANKADLDATEMLAEATDRDLNASADALLTDTTSLLSEIQDRKDILLTSLRSKLEAHKKMSNHQNNMATDLSERVDMVSNGIDDLSQVHDDEVDNVKDVSSHAVVLAMQAMETADRLEENLNQAPDPDFPISVRLTEVQDIVDSAPGHFGVAKTRVDELKWRVSRLERFREDLGLDDKIKQIRKLIQLSRSRAESAKVSMKFQSSDGLDVPEYVQPRLPPQVSASQEYVRVELYVNVAEKPDNSIFYWGDTSSSDGDFMSLETRNGLVYFNYKVGNGVGEIASTGRINDNEWHRIAIQRIGNNGKLEVEVPNPDGGLFDNVVTITRQGKTDGEDVKTTMNRYSTAFVIGGVPFETLPSVIENRQMSGCVKALSVNGERVGLWNFVSYSGPKPGNNCLRGSGISEDNRLWRFRGWDSYLKVSANLLRRQGFVISPDVRASIVQFKFSTMQSDALLFLVGKTRDQFFAIELRNGKFVISCNFGWEEPKNETVNGFPDVNTLAQPLSIKAGFIVVSSTRIMVVLAINSKLSLNMTFSSWAPNVVGAGWVGGIYKDDVPDELRQHVTTLDTHFRGCLGSLAFHFRKSFNVYSATERVGVTPGCRSEMIATLEVDGDDFISVPTNLGDAEEVSGLVTIQTSAPDGTIIVASETELNGGRVTLSMINGYIVLSDGELELRSMATYNDGHPHTIKFERYRAGVLYLNVDDTDLKELDTLPEDVEDARRRKRSRLRRRTSQSGAKTTLFAESRVHIFVGGSPDDTNFRGCIGYIQIDDDSRHPGLLTENARCGFSGNIKCVGKPRFNKCKMMRSGEVIAAQLASGAVSTITRDGVAEHEVSALVFTNGKMSLNGDHINGGNSSAVVVTPKKKKKGRKRDQERRLKNQRGKPGSRGQDTVLGIDADRLYNSGYDQNCNLPLNPASSGFLYTADGYAKYSVNNFNSLNWRFSLKMRTEAREGIVFFMCTAGCPEHVAVYLVKGKLLLSVKFGTERRRLKSENRYNDGFWHDITFQRKAQNLQMIIDDVIIHVEFFEISRTFSELMLFYVGGVQEMEKKDALLFMNEQHARDFNGCIQNLSVNDQPIETSTSSRLLVKLGLKSCFEGETESGIFFTNTEPSEDGAFMSTYNPYYIAANFEVSMEIRPRAQSGVLIAVGGETGNFLQVTLIDGKVVARVRQETDLLMSVYDPADFDDAICDGSWHKIEVIKAKNVLTLTVDGNMVIPAEQGDPSIIRCETDGPLYIGGIPREANVGRLLTDRRQYTGCMRKIRIDDFPVPAAIAVEVTPGVSTDSCPRY